MRLITAAVTWKHRRSACRADALAGATAFDPAYGPAPSRGVSEAGQGSSSRADLMKAAFGDAVVRTGIFDAREMPHGATRARTDTYFILHAPHAPSASLVPVDEAASGASRGDALRSAARLHEAARRAIQRPSGRGKGAGVHDLDRVPKRRGPQRDVGRGRLRDCDMEHRGQADENGQGSFGPAQRRRYRHPARSRDRSRRWRIRSTRSIRPRG